MGFIDVKNVRICEVGCRDGFQNEKRLVTTAEKIELINMMSDAGFPVIEVGSFMHPVKVPQMANTDEVFRGITKKPGIEYRALIPNARGVKRAIECGCSKVKLNVSASVAHNLANLNRTPAESVAGFAEAVELADDNGIGISGSISMPFGSPWDDTIPVKDVKNIVEAYMNVGIYEISLSDASGMAVPTQVYELCTEMRAQYPEVSWWLHFHNTRGAGLANILAGMEAGFSQFDTSFGGVGGCPFVPGAAGNVTTEDVLHMLQYSGVETGVDLTKAMEISRRVIEILGHSTESYLLRAGTNDELKLPMPSGQIRNQTELK